MRILGTLTKLNTTSERTPKKIPPHCFRYQETDLELTKKKTPRCIATAHRRLATHTQRYKVSPFRFYIYRLYDDKMKMIMIRVWEERDYDGDDKDRRN
jgi:hypothetical protein